MSGSMRFFMAMTLAATAASAQVRLPALPLPAVPPNALPQTLQSLDQVDSRPLDRLSDLRHIGIARLIRANPRLVDSDPNGEPVVRNEILVLSPMAAALDHARSLGFVVDREDTIGSLGIHLTILKAPPGMSTKNALRTLRKADPAGVYDYNHIYSGGGAMAAGGATAADRATTADGATAGRGAAGNASDPTRPHVRIGLLDTGVDTTHPAFRGSVVHTSGCENHPVPAAHGTAVASLLVGRAQVFQGVEPDAELYAADVYCGRPTGGAADALVAAFGWMVQEKVPVINVSLVGPKNIMLERVVGALVAAGYVIVAAVGNDGPAAPPLYPASYEHVVGVTAVDVHHRVLIEAARGPQVMFAAPGADLAAANADHAYSAVRGTSFAAPIVAGLLAARIAAPGTSDAQAAIDALAKTAVDLGPPGRDLTYGFGLVGGDYRVDPAVLNRR